MTEVDRYQVALETVYKQSGGSKKLAKELTDLEKKADDVEKDLKDVEKQFKKTDKEADSFSKTLKGFVGVAALTAGMHQLVQVNREFEKGMVNVATLVDTNTESMQAMKDQVVDISKRTPVALNDLTSGLYDVRSAGISAGDSMMVLERSAQLGVAGLSTTKEAVNLATSALNAFGLEGEAVEQAFDALFLTVKNGKTTVSELSQSFGNAAPVVASAGVSFNEFQAATAALTTSGQKASVAQNQLRQATVSLLKPTEEMKASLQRLGFASGRQAIENLGLVGTIQAVESANEGNDEMLGKAWGSVEALTAATALSGEQNEAYEVTLNQLETASGALTEAYEKQSDTLDSQLIKAQNNFNALLIQVGEAVLPIVNEELLNMLGATSEQADLLDQPIFKEDSDFTRFLVFVGDTLAGIAQVTDTVVTGLKGFYNVISTGAKQAGNVGSAIFTDKTMAEADAENAKLAAEMVQTAEAQYSGFMDRLESRVVQRTEARQKKLNEAAIEARMNQAKELEKIETENMENIEKIQDKYNQNRQASSIAGSPTGGAASSTAASKAQREADKLARSVESTENKYLKLRDRAEAALADLESSHAKNTAAIQAKIDDIKGALKDLAEEYEKSIGDLDQSLGSKFIEQEEKIKQLREDIQQKRKDGENTSELSEQLKKEEKALKEFKEKYDTVTEEAEGLADEIAEARRRRALTEFERFVEDAEARRETLTLEHEEKTRMLEEQLLEEQAALETEKAIYAEKREQYVKTLDQFEQMKTGYVDGMKTLESQTQKSVDYVNKKLAELERALSKIKALTAPKTGKDTRTLADVGRQIGAPDPTIGALSGGSSYFNSISSGGNSSTTNTQTINIPISVQGGSNATGEEIADALGKVLRDIQLQNNTR